MSAIAPQWIAREPRSIPFRYLMVITIGFIASSTSLANPLGSQSSTPDFNRDVRPILAKHCFACHGPDQDTREADLRLDQQSGSRMDLGGYQAIAPGDSENSEVIIRLLSDDDDLRMPPADSHPPLSQSDIDTLRSWIDAGAEYETHWSFRPSRNPNPPPVNQIDWCRGPIDRFVLARLEAADLSPSPPADKHALIRRLYMDLAGTTPSIQEVEKFLHDDSPDPYENVVDRLLASPEYGERFARSWLDLARYSDTNGYEKDRPRTIWPYRDWVINALNRDQPFDQFSIDQLAGDMLPDASRDQMIATGFHRNTMLNEEGGIDPLEYRFYAMVDRVATTGTVWMGLTTGCAQCHTHKFDPITHTDYFAMMALMDNADEPEWNADSDSVRQQRSRMQQQIDQAEIEIANAKLLGEHRDESLAASFREWKQNQHDNVTRWRTVTPTQMESTLPLLTAQEDGSILASGDATKRDVYTLTFPPLVASRDRDSLENTAQPITAIRIVALTHESLPAKGPGLAFYEGRRGDFFLSELEVRSQGDAIELGTGTTSVADAKPGNGKTYPGNVLDGDGSTGWSIPNGSGSSQHLVIPLTHPVSLDSAWEIEMLFERHYVAGLGHFRIDVTSDANPVAMQIPTELQSQLAELDSTDDIPDAINQRLAIEYLRDAKEMAPHRKRIDQLRKRIPSETRTLVLQERPTTNRRTTRRHHRGEYLQPKESVAPSVPAVFQSAEHSAPTNRLEFARWLTSPANPLIGRVTANRAWREFFGVGIVRTAGDFGTQSESPSHPDLLDYLGHRLRDRSEAGHRWSIKRLHREIVTSATYRQAIGSAPATDPGNRLLSVFPYRRYGAEQIRDAYLSAAGLLSRQIGGPSVYPPQPTSVVQLAYGNTPWPTSKGANRFRRSLYTYSKRTAPFAAYTTFDAPSGELCIARRDRSTTPLQALTLLNDEMFLEIAAGLADSAQRSTVAISSSKRKEAIATTLFRKLLIRPPTPRELESILTFHAAQSEHENPWMLVARALMNTDEAITTP